MNYRHAYHAGNHADVVKHAVLALAVAHFRKKDKPFRFLDLHAGIGVYDLSGSEAEKTREWQGGVGRMAEKFAAPIEALLAPYRESLAALNSEGGSRFYPGSPWLAARLMRPEDRLNLNELHPEDAQALRACFRRDRRVTITELDAAIAIRAQLPPSERRGLVLIDPPYEAKDEAEKALTMLRDGLSRFATGCFLLWFPVKSDGTADRLRAGAAALGVPGTLHLTLRVRESFRGGGLAGSGLIIVNPPWRLDEELKFLMPALAERLRIEDWGQASVSWLLPPL
ncbi:MAG: 23S rRNA (adenine(2030)-N(6))-methyltransferase RlmJ [Alphaproteobacteria bacterium]|nr:23S rRNA (adenine(2030)-N(6))-methyltransferase RlmJ [Alphaproteobacteria bacterium]